MLVISGLHVCSCPGHRDLAVMPSSLLSWMELRARRAELEHNQSLALFVSLLCAELTACASKSLLFALPHCCFLPRLTSLWSGGEITKGEISESLHEEGKAHHLHGPVASGSFSLCLFLCPCDAAEEPGVGSSVPL